MSAPSTLGGVAVTKARLQIPAWGLPFADVELAQPTTLTGRVSLVLRDLTWTGTVLDGGTNHARSRYRIVGGNGGWGKTVAAKSYANDAGVKRSTILTDVAAACGETMGTIPTGTVGAAFVRAEGPAVAVLDAVSDGEWYVDEAGVTQLGARAASTYAGSAPRIDADPAQSWIELAADAIATLLPGVTVDGVEAVHVEHCLERSKLRTTLWGRRAQRTGNPDAAALARIVDVLTAGHRFYAPWEYRVVTRSADRYALQIVRASSGMPNLASVKIRPGVAGLRALPKLGSLVLVQFVNGDPARPVIVGFDDAEGSGFETTDMRLGLASATDPVVRMSDLQAALDDVTAWADAHIHAETGTNTNIPTTLLGSLTATGSAVVKAV
jgi:hypothetical protein